MALPLLPIAVGLQAAGALASGVAGVRAANATFTDEEEARLKRLQRMRASGDLGLTDAQREVARNAALQGYQGDVARSQAQAAQAAQGGASPRDVFLSRMIAQQGSLDARARAQAEVFAADEAKKQAQRQEIARLEADEQARRAGRAAGVATALGGAAAAGAQAVQAKYQVQQMEKAQMRQATSILSEQKKLDAARAERERQQRFADQYNSLFIG